MLPTKRPSQFNRKAPVKALWPAMLAKSPTAALAQWINYPTPGIPRLPGDRVKVDGAPARNFPAVAIASSVKAGNGKPLFTGTTPLYEQ